MAWTVSGNIRGPQGEPGEAGEKGDTGNSLLVQGDVAAYANLPGGLTAADAGKAWLVLADGKLYEWSGSAFPSNGAGATFRGPQGEQGEPGADGADGADGAGIEIAGSVATYANLPTGLGAGDAGDGYLVQADGKLYIWDGTDFPADGSGVEFRGPKGDKGDKGDTGDQGEQGLQGIQGNPGTDGADGTDGQRGSVWFTGAGSPSGISGALAGDMYLDTVNGDVYQLS